MLDHALQKWSLKEDIYEGKKKNPMTSRTPKLINARDKNYII